MIVRKGLAQGLRGWDHPRDFALDESLPAMSIRPSFRIRTMLLATGLAVALPEGAQANYAPAATAAHYAPAASAANPFADLAAIDAQVAAFTGHAIGQTGGASTAVDRRLRLNACRSPLALSWRAGRRETVLVECPDLGSWRLFVPVRAAEVSTGLASVAVARGEQVTVAVVGEGFSISQPGEAMDSGGVGEWIRVRGVKNGTPQGDAMRAMIIRPGTVEVQLRD
jgi:flagella basal body P-ring formation protein FlgA